jgi:RimJ/RimL family protein N-acetyltransferase
MMGTLIEIPTLRTEHLTLRAFRASDFDGYAAMQADPEIRRFLGSGKPLSRSEAWLALEALLGQWALRGYGLFAVEAADGTLAGRIGVLHPYDWPEPELAYMVARTHWGRGVASEAAAAVRDWVFASFSFPRLVSFIRPANVGSIRGGQGA